MGWWIFLFLSIVFGNKETMNQIFKFVLKYSFTTEDVVILQVKKKKLWQECEFQTQNSPRLRFYSYFT